MYLRMQLMSGVANFITRRLGRRSGGAVAESDVADVFSNHIEARGRSEELDVVSANTSPAAN